MTMAMTTVYDLQPLQQRKVAAIVGACVADAAAQPLQWIYKDDVMQSITNGKEEIEFHTPSANPFYRIETGRNTCYADQAYVMLKSLVDSGGLNIEHLTSATYGFFGPESEYECQETNQYVVGKEDKINVKKSYPINGPWRNGCLKDFIRNIQEQKSPTGSKGDDQIDCVIRIIPLVALYAGHPDMLVKVEEGLRVLQDSDMSVVCGLATARVLEQYILHGNPENVLETVLSALSDPQRKNPQELDQAVVGQIRQVVSAKDTLHYETVNKIFQKNCHLPQSMQSALHGLITATSYIKGIRATIRAGGCHASRSGFIGACMAVKEGIDTIPENWRTRTFRFSEVLDLAVALSQIQV